jgi:hypothetical protein
MSPHIAVHSPNLPYSLDWTAVPTLGATKITLGATVARKQFHHWDAADRVAKLVDIYKLLKEKQVPNVDALHRFSQEPGSFYVITKPVGVDVSPKSGFEAFAAIVCLLQALKVY